MGIRNQDRLADLIGDDRSDRRFEWWLWHTLFGACLDHQNNDLFDTGMARERMANEIIARNFRPNQFLKKFELRAVSSELLSWISNDVRQHEYILSITPVLAVNNNLYVMLHNKCTGRDKVILAIDLVPNSGVLSSGVAYLSKVSFVEDLKHRWVHHNGFDKRLDWFKEKDVDIRRAALWEFAQKICPAYLCGMTSFDSHSKVLMFFDRAKFTEHQEQLYIEQIKKKVSQKKYRDGLVGKKQYNFILPDKLVNNLDRIAENHNLSRSQVLEILIKSEVSENLYMRRWESFSRSYNAFAETVSDEPGGRVLVEDE